MQLLGAPLYPYFERHPGSLSIPPNFPWARRSRTSENGDVPARNLRPGSATPAPAFPGMHAALASTRGGAPALLRQNAGLDHAGRPVRAASGNRTR
eukprot:scaffold46154_cov60-Phaeocystis_antarctica.AAC.1